VAEVLQRTLNASVTPGAVLGGHSQDQVSRLSWRGWSVRWTLAAGIIFLSNERLVPTQERARRGNSSDLPGR
jgi:hypothetical protein